MRFRERVAIQQPVRTKSPTGQTLHGSFADVAELADVAAVIDPAPLLRGGEEMHTADMTVVEETYQVVLAGYFPQITSDMQVLAGDGTEYEVMGAQAQRHRRRPRTIVLARRISPKGTT